MHWDTFDRLEQKDLEADREKMLLMLAAEISRLEGEFRDLPVEAADDMLENNRAG